MLKPNILTVTDLLAQSLTAIGPVFTVTFLTSFVVNRSGWATPVTLLLCGIATLAMAYIIVQFTLHYPTAGTVYGYVTHAFGPLHGFVVGWVYLFGMVIITTAIAVVVAMGGAAFIDRYIHWTPPWFLLLLVEMAVLYFFSLYSIRRSTQIQLGFVVFSIVGVIVLSLTIIMGGGKSGNSITPFIPLQAGSLNNLVLGLLFSMLFFRGFEAAAALAEETKDIERAMPIAIIGTVVIVTLFYGLITYTYAIGYGREGVSAWSTDRTPLFTMIVQYWGEWAIPVFVVLVLRETIVTVLASLNTITRLLFVMGRDGVLPPILGRVHPTYQTPYIASGVVIMFVLLIAAFFFGMRTMIGAQLRILLLLGLMGIVFTYIYVAFAALIHFRPMMKEQYSYFKHMFIPLIAAILPSLIFVRVLSAPTFGVRIMAYIIILWAILGLMFFLGLRYFFPEMATRVEQTFI